MTGNEPSSVGSLRKVLKVRGGASPDAAGDEGVAGQVHRKLRVGFVSYATGPYNSFAEELWESIQAHAFPGEEVHFFLFTDRAANGSFLPGPLVHKRQQERLGWPFDSLGRHFLYLEASEWFVGMDYILAIDSDAKVVGHLDDGMLGHRIGTLQAWSFGRERNLYTYDSRLTPARTPYSAAYIGPNEGMCYFCGGLFGGSLLGFLGILEDTVALARRDLSANPPHVALWHDESYLNRVFLDNPPSVVLSPAFMYPEPPAEEWLMMQDSKQGMAAWKGPGRSGQRFLHKIYNLGVRKHRTQSLDEFQPLSATLPAIMSTRGAPVPFPLPRPLAHLASQVSFIVKAFERPTCIRRLMRSVAAHYPGFSLLVLDDSSSPVLSEVELEDYGRDLRITYLRAEPDVGLAEGRNRLVDAVSTPYVFLLDDDFELHPDKQSDGQMGSKLAGMVAALDQGPYDIVGGCVDSTQGSAWSYSLARYDKMLLMTADVPCAAAETPPRPPDYASESTACWHVDMILNFFLARTSFLQSTRWDPLFKVGEHEDFFLRAKDLGGRVAMCRGLTAQNDNTCDASAAYKAKRRRVFDYWVHLFRKHNLREMRTAAGTYKLNCKSPGDCSIDVSQEGIWFN